MTSGLVNNVRSALAAEVIVSDEVEQPSWLVSDARRGEYLALTNGLLCLDGPDAGTIRAHTPEWFSSVCLPYVYDAKAECPQWEAFLKRVLEGDHERIAILQEWFGYNLTPDTSFHKFMVMEGEGANGKSVVLDVLEAVLGSDNVSHVPLDAFGGRFQLVPTLNKLANIAPETNENVKFDEGMFKQVVAGDTVYLDRKGISGISAKPTARVTIATNNRPPLGDRSNGIWRRLILVPFRVTIPTPFVRRWC